MEMSDRLPADLDTLDRVDLGHGPERVRRVTPHPGGWVIVATSLAVYTLDGSRPVACAERATA